MSKRRPYQKTDYKKFIKAYLACDFNDEVATKMGWKNSTKVAETASKLRRLGVKLPTRVNTRPPQSQIDEMNDLIKAIEATNKGE